MDYILLEIKQINEQMKHLTQAKNKASEQEIQIIEDELIELETKLECKISERNNLLELQQYQSICNHVFIEDLIDLTPDTSKTITYCVHCLLEKK
jgi:hypothetical protein